MAERWLAQALKVRGALSDLQTVGKRFKWRDFTLHVENAVCLLINHRGPSAECVRHVYPQHGMSESPNRASKGVLVNLNQVTLPVRDMDTATDFYRRYPPWRVELRHQAC